MLITRNTQPQQASQINPYWLAKGLTFADYGNGIVWTKEAGNNVPASDTGTRSSGGKYGVSTGYGTTAGVATTDIQTSAFCTITNRALSIIAFGNAKTSGGASGGRIFQPIADAGNASATAMYFISGNAFVFNRFASGGVGAWVVAGSPILGRWVSYGVTHNPQGVVATFPSLYIDGVPQTVASTFTPTGTYLASQKFQITRGNRSTDSARNWDGYLGPLFIFNGVLTDADHASLTANPWQIFVPLERSYGRNDIISVARNPLVLINGVMQELPAGQQMFGVPSGGSFSFTASGSTVLDFGIGSNTASTVLSSLGLSTSTYVNAWISPLTFTANGITHTADDHKYVAALMKVDCINIGVNGGVTIVGTSIHKLNGQFSINFSAI